MLGFFGLSTEMPCQYGSQFLPGPGEQLSSHTHVQAGPGSSWMLRKEPEQKHYSSSSHSHQGAQKTGPGRTRDTAWGRVTQWPARKQAQDYRSALNTACIQKRCVCGRQLRTGMRVSCHKHGLPPLPPCKIPNPFVRGQSTKFCLLPALLFTVV